MYAPYGTTAWSIDVDWTGLITVTNVDQWRLGAEQYMFRLSPTDMSRLATSTTPHDIVRDTDGESETVVLTCIVNHTDAAFMHTKPAIEMNLSTASGGAMFMSAAVNREYFVWLAPHLHVDD